MLKRRLKQAGLRLIIRPTHPGSAQIRQKHRSHKVTFLRKRSPGTEEGNYRCTSTLAVITCSAGNLGRRQSRQCRYWRFRRGCRFQLIRRLSRFRAYFFQINRDWNAFFQLIRRLFAARATWSASGSGQRIERRINSSWRSIVSSRNKMPNGYKSL